MVGPKDLAAWRLRNLHLAGPPLADPVAVVRWLGAVQSQDFGPAKWSVAARTTGATNADLDDLFNAGQILRTHVLRPTWHFVLPEDIRLLLQVTGPRVQARNRPRYRQLGLDPALLDRSAAIVVEALQGGQHRTRRELGSVLEGNGIDVEGQRLAYIVMNAELEALICSGALDGKQHTYAVLDERAPDVAHRTADDALAELTRRYFTSHGPATVKDFQSWSGLTLTDIRRGLQIVGHLEPTEVDGHTFWSAGGPPEDPPGEPAGHLLQLYDEYIMGYRETRGVMNVDREGEQIALRPSFNGLVVVDTQAVGEWKRVVLGRRTQVRVRPTRSLRSGHRRAIEAAAARYERFLETTVELQFTDHD